MILGYDGLHYIPITISRKSGSYKQKNEYTKRYNLLNRRLKQKIGEGAKYQKEMEYWVAITTI